MRDKKLVSQLTMQQIRAKTAVKTNTSHYALARTKEENQQLNRAACLLSPHYGMQYGEGKKVETLSAVLSQINNGSRVSRSVKKTWSCPNLRTPPSIRRYVNIAGCCCCGLRFHATHPVSWWKWKNATGYLKTRGKPGTSIHCTHTWTSTNWFSPAGTCPHHQTTNVSVILAGKAYCANLLSHQS